MITERKVKMAVTVVGLLAPLLASFALTIWASVFLYRYGVRIDRVVYIAYLSGACTYVFYPRLAERYSIGDRVDEWVGEE